MLTSHVLAAICNSQMGRTKPVKPHELNPMYEPPPVSLADLFGLTD
ncbi:hypothetical protein SH661x_001944 [Planctomicrobium sp. SH661]